MPSSPHERETCLLIVIQTRPQNTKNSLTDLDIKKICSNIRIWLIQIFKHSPNQIQEAEGQSWHSNSSRSSSNIMKMMIGSQQTWRQIFRYQQQQFVCDTESEKERVNKNQKDAERNRYADGDKIKQKTKSKKQPPKINLIVTERSSLLPTAAKFSACGVSCCRNASEWTRKQIQKSRNRCRMIKKSKEVEAKSKRSKKLQPLNKLLLLLWTLLQWDFDSPFSFFFRWLLLFPFCSRKHASCVSGGVFRKHRRASLR